MILIQIGCPHQRPELRSHLVNSLLNRELQTRVPNLQCTLVEGVKADMKHL
jgi:hypothetical protein